MFDFSVAKTQESFHESLKNFQLPSVDLIQIHDEFAKFFKEKDAPKAEKPILEVRRDLICK